MVLSDRPQVVSDEPEMPVLSVRVRCETHYGMEFTGSIRLDGWTGKVVGAERDQEPPPPGVQPRLVRLDVAEVARTKWLAAGIAPPMAATRVDLTWLGDHFQWSISWLQTVARANGVLHCILIDDRNGVARAVNQQLRSLPPVPGPQGPPVSGGDLSVSVGWEGQVVVASNRPRRQVPWWYQGSPYLLLVQNGVWKWVASSFTHCYAGGTACGKRLVGDGQGVVQFIDLKRGTYADAEQAFEPAPQNDGLSAFVVRRKGDAEAILLWDAAKQLVSGPPLAAHVAGVGSLASTSSGDRVAYVAGNRRLMVAARDAMGPPLQLMAADAIQSTGWRAGEQALWALTEHQAANGSTYELVDFTPSGSPVRREVLPERIARLQPRSWCETPAGLVSLFVARWPENDASASTTALTWNRQTGAVSPVIGPGSEILPYRWDDGLTAVDTAARAEVERWQTAQRERRRRTLDGRRLPPGQ